MTILYFYYMQDDSIYLNSYLLLLINRVQNLRNQFNLMRKGGLGAHLKDDENVKTESTHTVMSTLQCNFYI